MPDALPSRKSILNLIPLISQHNLTTRTVQNFKRNSVQVNTRALVSHCSSQQVQETGDRNLLFPQPVPRASEAMFGRSVSLVLKVGVFLIALALKCKPTTVLKKQEKKNDVFLIVEERWAGLGPEEKYL